MTFSWIGSLSAATLVFGTASIVFWVAFAFLAWLKSAAEDHQREAYVYYNTLPDTTENGRKYIHAVALRGDLLRGEHNANRTGRHTDIFKGKLALLNLVVIRSDKPAQQILADLEQVLGRYAYKRENIFVPTAPVYTAGEREELAKRGCTFTQIPEGELCGWILSHQEWLDRVAHYHHDHPSVIGQWRWAAFGLAFAVAFVTAFLVGRDATVLGWWR